MSWGMFALLISSGDSLWIALTQFLDNVLIVKTFSLAARKISLVDYFDSRLAIIHLDG